MILMSGVSIASSILITDGLNHSENNIDLHASVNRNALLWLFVMYVYKSLIGSQSEWR